VGEKLVEDIPEPTPTGRARRLSLAIALLVLVSAVFSVPSLQDAVTASPVPFAARTQPFAYLVGAPLFGVWDTLSLLTLSQHYAVLVTLGALYVSARLRAPKGSRSRLHNAGAEALRAVIGLAALLAFYAAGLLLPRPMTGIQLSDADLVSIDFHSHTNRSHDGWSLFTAPRNRAWHEGGGFDVGYVTDHYTWEGFDEAEPDNPDRAGERTVLLSGAEIRVHRRPTNILGNRDRYLFALDSARIYMNPDSIAAGYARGGRPPTLLYTMPGGLRFVIPFTEDSPSGVIGIELNDGSPRGLEQVKAERAEIIALADSLDLALLGASNLHGWGRTVASWSVMSVPGWQEMTPPRLADAIEEELHTSRRSAVLVVERRMPYHDGSPAKIILTVPWLTWEYFRMLSWPERLSWLVWTAVAGWLLAAHGRRTARRARREGQGWVATPPLRG
jgi:hypothetical protein